MLSLEWYLIGSHWIRK